MDGSAGFHATAFTHPFVCPSRVSINKPFSLCHMYTLESRKICAVNSCRFKYKNKSNNEQKIHTLAAADDQALVRPTKRTPDDKVSLLLTDKFLHDICRLDIDHVYFVIGCIDQHVFRVSADTQGCHVAFQQNAILFLPRNEIVNEYLPFN